MSEIQKMMIKVYQIRLSSYKFQLQRKDLINNYTEIIVNVKMHKTIEFSNLIFCLYNINS